MTIDPKLIEWATVRQLEYIEAIEKHGGVRSAAKALDVAVGTIGNAMAELRRKAAIHGYSPAHHLTRPIAPGLRMRGTSQLYRRGEPDPVLEWVKTSADEQAQAAMRKAAFEALSEELPRVTPLAAPPFSDARLCTLYTLTDSHVGALCWHKEGGADWDLKIAEQVLVGCFAKMLAASPDSRVGVVAQLGDFLHQDGILPVTPQHGHILDADGRFTKVVQVAVRVLRRVVDMALAKHSEVIVLLAEGNHDISSSIWLRTMFAALYENEPRIKVIGSPLPYYAYQHGKTMLCWHHGHLRKPDQLPILFAAQFPAMWGATVKRYAHCGHQHHVNEKEHSGITVTQHPTLAARDAYAARGGWIADRQVSAITYHDQFGIHSRVTICPEMLEAA